MRNNALVVVVVLALLAAGAYAVYSRSATNTSLATPVSVEPAATPGERVVAEAKVVPVERAALSFASGGIIDKLLIHTGDQVQAGQPLATFETTIQQANLAQAQANLAQAQASYQDLVEGATSQDLAMAEAQLRQSQAQLRTASGSVTPDDLAAATAQLQQSQALLVRLTAGAKATDLRAAEAQLQQAQAQLQTQRDQLSATKTNAELQMRQSTDALTQAQSRDATAKQNWQYVQDTGRDPIAPSLGIDPKTGQKIPNTLSDAQRQQYYDAFVQAEAAVRSAESAVQAARVTYDTARQAEVSGIQAAENQVTSAQANLDKLQAGADADQIAAARAQVASAKANLRKLQGDQHDGTVAAAQAAVDSAQAQLDKLRAGASKSKLAVAQAQVRSAQAALDLAQAALDEQTLRAPFAGKVAAVNLRAGEFLAPGAPAIQLADLAAWQIETDDVTERSIANIRVGAPATITFDALPGVSLAGKVTRIDAFGANNRGDITYTVVVSPDRLDDRLRWNMTATVTIDTSGK